MSLKQFWRAMLAYLFCSGAVAPVAYVGSRMAQAWAVDVTFWQVAGALWFCCVGIPSMAWSTGKLSRVLGVRPSPSLRVGNWRSISVGSPVGDTARSVFGVGGGSPRSLKVADDLLFTAGDVSISESEMLHFLRRCWQRQRSGRAPFARSYWTRELDRSTYDATMDIVSAAGLVVNRKAGYSGRMLFPPLTAMSDLRHKLA